MKQQHENASYQLTFSPLSLFPFSSQLFHLIHTKMNNPQTSYGYGAGVAATDPFMRGFPNSYSPGLGQTQVSVGRHSGMTGPHANFRSLSLNEQREMFFGKSNPLSSMAAAEDQYPTENRIRPFQWIGKNLRVRTILIRRIEATDDFIIRRLLPITQLPDGNRIDVHQLEYNSHLLDDIPEQGTPRLTSSTFKMWSYTMKRKGLAFMMEDGFAMTDMGIESYAASILQISNATVDTMVLDAYYNLLSCRSAADDFYQAFGITHNNATRDDLFAYEKKLWSVFSKTEYGFWHMMDMGRKVFAVRRITPDALILPNGSRMYLKRNRPETIDYSRIGPAGPDAYLSARGFIQRADDLEIYEAAMYTMTDSELPEDPLVRDRSIGEFGDSNVNDNFGELGPDQYKTSLRNREIHDNATDMFQTIKFEDMWEHSGLFDTAGELSEDVGRPFFSGCNSIGQYLYRTKSLDKFVKFMEAKVGGAATIAAAAGQAPGTQGRFDRSSDAMDAFSAASSGGRTSGKFRSDDSTQERFSGQEFYTLSDHNDLATINSEAGAAKLLDHISASGNNDGSFLFEAFKSSSSDPTKRTFGKTQVKVLAGQLEAAYSNQSYDQVKMKPWVQWLRMYYADHSKQAQLYNTLAGETETAAGFLHNLYGNQPNSGKSTGAVFVHALAGAGREKAPAELPAAAAYNALSRQEVEMVAKAFARSYPQIERVLPDFLGGSFVMLAQLYGDVDKARKAVQRSLIPLATWISENHGRSQAIVTSSTAGGAANRAIRIIQRSVSNAYQVETLVAWYEINKNNLYKSEADAATAVADLDSRLTESLDSGASQKLVESESGTNKIKRDLYRIRITNQFFKSCMDENIPVFVDFVFVRPSMNYEMGSGVMMKSGAETGATFFGEPDFELSNDGNRKTLVGFFTCYAGARVYKPQNVHILHNITCKRYISGGGVQMYHNLRNYDREAWASGQTLDKDLFIIPMYPNESIRDIKFDITGFFPDEIESGNSQVRQHYAMAYIMQALWGFQHRESFFDIEYFGSPTSAYNTVAFRMHQFVPRAITNAGINPRGYHKQGQGHWGANVYNGVREDRCGSGNGYVMRKDWALEGSIQIN